MQTKNSPFVSVVMITYGHEKFIQQAIEGVLMQQFNGEIELIIANDNSPDSTDEVVKGILKSLPKNEWIKYTRHKSNLGMMPNFIWALQQAKGKYIALCEGDDYWKDPYKIQKQVDYLEVNPECIVTGHDAIIVDENNKLISNSKLDANSKQDATSDQLKRGFVPLTLTTLFRNINFKEHFKQGTKGIYNGDLYLACVMGNYGYYHYMDNVKSAAYRLHLGGVWSLKTKNIKLFQNLNSFYQISKYYKNRKDYKYAFIFSIKVFTLLIYEKNNLWGVFKLERNKILIICLILLKSILNMMILSILFVLKKIIGKAY